MTGRSTLHPLTPLQAGIATQWLADPAGMTGTVQHRYTVDGRLDLELLGLAWRELSRRHAAMRSRVTPHDGDLMLEVADEAPSGYRVVTADANFPAPAIDPTRLPLVFLDVQKLGPDRHRLTWYGHHVAVDGWSRTVLMNRMFTYHDNALRGAVPAPPVVDRLPQALDTIAALDRTACMKFWTDYLRPYAVPVEPPSVSGVHRTSTALLDHGLVERLGRAARATRVTVATLTSAAWGVCLRRVRKVRAVVFGAVSSGRGALAPNARDAVGMLACTLPTVVDESVTFEPKALRRFQIEQVRCRTYEHPELWEVSSALGLRVGESLFRELFAFENYPGQRQGVGTGVIVNVESTIHRTGYTAALSVQPCGVSLLLHLDWLAPEVAGGQLLHDYVETLRCAAASLGGP